MKWVTRSHVHVDRVACPWLIRRFVDSAAEFIFVPKSQVNKVADIKKGILLTSEGEAGQVFRGGGGAHSNGWAAQFFVFTLDLILHLR